MSEIAQDQCSPYNLLPQTPFGAVIENFNLKHNLVPSVISSIKKDLTRYSILIFRDQGTLSADEQVKLTQCFGEIEIAGFFKHKSSPHDFILRVSNCTDEGYMGIGESGFHVDTSFLERPSSMSIYHIIETPSKGNTQFVSLNDVYQNLTEARKEVWDQLWLVKTYKNIPRVTESPGVVVHPLVYRHPVTGENTLLIHQGKTSSFLFGTDKKRVALSKDETAEIVKEINDAIYIDNGRLIYSHTVRN